MTEIAIALVGIVGIAAVLFASKKAEDARIFASEEVIRHRESVLAFHRASMATDAREQVALDRADPATADRRAELELAARDRMRRGDDSIVDFDEDTRERRVPVGMG